MPNQYSDNFELNVLKKYGKSAEQVLSDLHDQGVSYVKASEMMGYQVWTVKRWCRRYGISLAQKELIESNSNREFMNKFHEQALNKYNILSRKWVALH
ncbi:hypothetical protein [Fastidiosibacter lacustris]|uniref:hypothetical protein n=1 Tax=Fastidiosibacter lacustris TaxID=2056695 RepID=UPI000E344DBB|nr:hypothetical protein [Fastidiosibacter lacustris]